MTEAKTGPELVEEIAADPTIDEMLRRDPRQVGEDDLLKLVEAHRLKRAQFIKDSDKRRAKRQGQEVEEDEE